MKRIYTLLLLAAAMAFTMPASAQVKFGLKGGLNVTSMSFSSDVLDASNRAGFFIGPTIKLTVPVVGLSFDASALYDQREAKVKVDDTTVGNSLKTKSINIPINVRYGWGLGSMANVFVFAGPQFGFNVGDKDQKITEGTTWQLKSSNFSVNVGAGVTVLSHLQLTANYNIACGKTGDVTVGGVVSDVTSSKGNANSWQIGLAYYF